MDYPKDLCFLTDKILCFSAQMLCRLILKKSRMDPLTALTKKRLMLWIYLASCPFLLHPCSHLLWKEKLEHTFVKICFLSWRELNHKSLKSAHPDKESTARRNESVWQLIASWMSPVLQTAAGTSSLDCPLSPVNERYCVHWLLVTEFNTKASNLIPAAHGPTATCPAADRLSWQFSTTSCELHASLGRHRAIPRSDHLPGFPETPNPRLGFHLCSQRPHLISGKSQKDS